jgi:hypothetical protein
MNRHFSAFLIITTLIVSSLGFSSFASAAAPKTVTYYTAQGTQLYKDKNGAKAIKTLPTNTKLYLQRKPAKNFYRITYGKTTGYITIKNLSKTRFATYKDFEGSWYFGNKTKHVKYQIMITKSGIDYNYSPEAMVGYIKFHDLSVNNNTLQINHATLHSDGDGTQTWGELTQTLKLSKKDGKIVLVASKPTNKEISGFQGIGVRK